LHNNRNLLRFQKNKKLKTSKKSEDEKATVKNLQKKEETVDNSPKNARELSDFFVVEEEPVQEDYDTVMMGKYGVILQRIAKAGGFTSEVSDQSLLYRKFGNSKVNGEKKESQTFFFDVNFESDITCHLYTRFDAANTEQFWLRLDSDPRCYRFVNLDVFRSERAAFGGITYLLNNPKGENLRPDSLEAVKVFAKKIKDGGFVSADLKPDGASVPSFQVSYGVRMAYQMTIKGKDATCVWIGQAGDATKVFSLEGPQKKAAGEKCTALRNDKYKFDKKQGKVFEDSEWQVQLEKDLGFLIQKLNGLQGVFNGALAFTPESLVRVIETREKDGSVFDVDLAHGTKVCRISVKAPDTGAATFNGVINSGAGCKGLMVPGQMSIKKK